MSDSLIGFLRGILTEYFTITSTMTFEKFFYESIGLSGSEAQLSAYCYLATTDVFGVAPGFGLLCSNARTMAAPKELMEELRKLNVGKFKIGVLGIDLELRTAEYLATHKTALAARKNLTPAKRDALRMELRKLIQVPEAAWKRYYPSKSASTGVRG